jgi:glycosyltransferase involved in cell wall biosynthesis
LKNGYLAKCFCTEDLAKGINWVLNFELVEKLRKSSREKVELKFDKNIVSQQMIELYNSVLEV